MDTSSQGYAHPMAGIEKKFWGVSLWEDLVDDHCEICFSYFVFVTNLILIGSKDLTFRYYL